MSFLITIFSSTRKLNGVTGRDDSVTNCQSGYLNLPCPPFLLAFNQTKNPSISCTLNPDCTFVSSLTPSNPDMNTTYIPICFPTVKLCHLFHRYCPHTKPNTHTQHYIGKTSFNHSIFTSVPVAYV